MWLIYFEWNWNPRLSAEQTGQFIEDVGKSFREPDISKLYGLFKTFLVYFNWTAVTNIVLEPSEIGRETDMNLPLNFISKRARPEKVQIEHTPFAGHPADDDFDVSV